MTQDEIIEMANRAGIVNPQMVINTLEAFAKLVVEKAVRESSAEYRLGWNDGQIAEREACAKVCETFDQREAFNDEDMAVADACADAIRARGQA
jgi:hypothetical protein